MACTLKLLSIEEYYTLSELPTEGNLHCYMVYAVNSYSTTNGIMYRHPVFLKVAEVAGTTSEEECMTIAGKHDEVPAEFQTVKDGGATFPSLRFGCMFFCVDHTGKVSHQLEKPSL